MLFNTLAFFIKNESMVSVGKTSKSLVLRSKRLKVFLYRLDILKGVGCSRIHQDRVRYFSRVLKHVLCSLFQFLNNAKFNILKIAALFDYLFDSLIVLGECCGVNVIMNY